MDASISALNIADKTSAVPPQNLEAEQTLLGAMMISSQAIADISEVLLADDFYRQAHRHIFQAISELYASGEPADAITVSEKLKNKGVLEEVGGKSYIVTLISSVPTPGSAIHYAEIVRRCAILRQLLNIAHEIADIAFSSPEDANSAVDQAEGLMFSIARKSSGGQFDPVKSILHEVIEQAERISNSDEHITGIPTGFKDFDKKTTGLHPSDLIIIAGRPSMGKTSLALNIAEHVGLSGTGVAIFSLEMSKQQLAMRLLCSEAEVDAYKVRTGHLSERDWEKLISAASKLSESNIYIDDSPSLNPLEIRAKARRLMAKHNIGLIVVDYMQLMHSFGFRKNDTREQEVSQISRALKTLGRELNVPIVAISQLSRAVEKRDHKKPMLSDLRECVTGETLVVLKNGKRLPIRELVGKKPNVLAISPEGKIISAKSDKVWSVGKRPVLKINLASGRSIRATAKHRLLGNNGWTRIEDLSGGDRIALARSIPQPSRTMLWPDNRVALLGQLIGDGSYLSGQPMRYTTASSENSEIVTQSAQQEFGAKVKVYDGRGNWHQLLISGNGNRWHPSGVNAWLRELGIFGQRSHEKRIPDQAFSLSNRQVALLLKHLWATDGTITPRPVGEKGAAGVFFSTSSRGLADDVAFLLLRLGIVSRIRKVTQNGSRPWYNVNISGADNLSLFLDKVGAFGPRIDGAIALANCLKGIKSNTNVDTLPKEVFLQIKQLMADRGISHRAMQATRGVAYGGSAHYNFAPSRSTVTEYAEILESTELFQLVNNDIFWDRIIEILPDGEEEVFDLTVPGPASWLADGIVSHNSGAIEQDADLVIFIYKEEDKSQDDDDDEFTPFPGDKEDKDVLVEIDIAKHRNGPTGKIQLLFKKQFAKFANLDQHHTEN